MLKEFPFDKRGFWSSSVDSDLCIALRIKGFGRSIIGTQIMDILSIVKETYYSLVPSPHSGGFEGAKGSRAMLISKVIILGAYEGS